MVDSHTDLEASERFRTPATRRDFLGLAAAWTAVLAFVMAMLGALRLPMPSVFPESNSRAKLGRPDRFQADTSTYFPKQQLWLYRGDNFGQPMGSADDWEDRDPDSGENNIGAETPETGTDVKTSDNEHTVGDNG